MNNKKQSLKQLQDFWYKKLKVDGFDDLEYGDDFIRSAKPALLRKPQTSTIYQESIEEYYYMATHFLNDFKFKSNVQRIIWEYHSNGISSRDIAKLLTKAKIRQPPKKSTVFVIIKRLEQSMYALYGIKSK